MYQNELDIEKQSHKDLLEMYKLLKEYTTKLEHQLEELKKEIEKNDWSTNKTNKRRQRSFKHITTK